MQGLFLKGIGRRFDDFWAVRDVTARVLPGKITALIGPNGAGKTTLLNLITGEMRPTQGRVLLDGHDMTGRAPWEVARLGVGRLFQDVRVFRNLSALDNVVLAVQGRKREGPLTAWTASRSQARHRREVQERARHWLEFFDLAQHEKSLAGELSFGQQKLLALARLVAADFKVFLLDEPTAGLHPKMIDRLEGYLRRLLEERPLSITLVEHNMSVVLELADWIHFMHEGRIAFSGRADHVLGAKDVRELYMGF